MAISYIAERYTTNSASSTNTYSFSPASNSTAGNTLILAMANATSILVTSVTDTAGNTWVVDKTFAPATTNYISIASCQMATAVTTSTTITVNYTGTAVWRNMMIEVSGLAASSRFDTFATSNTANASQSCGPTATLAVANEFAFCASYQPSGRTAFVASGAWTKTATGTTSWCSTYQIVAATTALTATASWSGAFANTNLLVTYKAVSGTANTQTNTGATTPTGLAVKAITTTKAGVITPTGAVTLAKTIYRTFTGAIAASGAIYRAVTKKLAGVITAVGDLIGVQSTPPPAGKVCATAVAATVRAVAFAPTVTATIAAPTITATAVAATVQAVASAPTVTATAASESC